MSDSTLTARERLLLTTLDSAIEAGKALDELLTNMPLPNFGLDQFKVWEEARRMLSNARGTHSAFVSEKRRK